ncbi:MAG: DUF1456 family protein [Marinomonas sp.]
MTNNDVLRRIRYILDLNDKSMIKIFALAEHTVDRAELSSLLKHYADKDFKACNDKLLAYFLNGLIVFKRGQRDGPKPPVESKLNNNMVFTKLKIAFSLTSDDIMELMALANFKLSKHELSAFFRKPTHQHFRPCKDQILRQFVKGLQIKHRGPMTDSDFED